MVNRDCSVLKSRSNFDQNPGLNVVTDSYRAAIL